MKAVFNLCAINKQRFYMMVLDFFSSKIDNLSLTVPVRERMLFGVWGGVGGGLVSAFKLICNLISSCFYSAVRGN